MRLKVLAGLVLLSGMVSTASQACPLTVDRTGPVIRSVLHDIAVKTEPARVQVGQPFEVSVIACNKDGTPFNGELTANASMPMHKHGMNYAPKVTSQGNGAYHGTGFLFHMPGKWQYVFDLDQGEQSSRILHDFILK